MKKLLMAAVAASSLAATPALAATDATYDVTGSVNSACGIAASGTVAFSALANADGTYASPTATAANDTTAYCNQAGTTVDISHTAMTTDGTAPAGFTKTLDFTPVVSFNGAAGLNDGTAQLVGAFGSLSVEAGTHRLARISPFGSADKRQTSFAAVEVIPLMEEATEVDIPEGDIRVDVFRSSGPGGQSVNTTDSAVRLTHLPTGIVVSMQNEKSQIQNRAAAMRVLQTRLLLLQKEEEAAKKKELAGNITASWGDQMRSYFLYGQQLVKDLRTGHEVGNPAIVFDGDLDGFISAGIRWRKRKEED